MRTIGSDAHVLETAYTWDFMDEADRRYAPMIVSQTSGVAVASNDGKNQAKDFWVSDGRLILRDKNVGNDAPEAAREMRDIDEALRLLKTNGRISPYVVDKILGDNARALYGL